jgi:hypothetical protein
MNSQSAGDRAMESYLERLRVSLRPLPADQADDIVREIRSHLLDSAGGGAAADPRRLSDAIARLGNPATLANAYVMDHLALQAQASRSPILLLRLAGLWATRSLEGLVALVLAVIGYAIALIGLGCAFFKPFTPDRIGLWVQRVPPDDFSFQLGRVAVPPGDAREVLGWYIIPLGLIIGAIAFAATTRYLLAKARKYRKTRVQDSSAAAASSGS